jgi:hypothetical protein
MKHSELVFPVLLATLLGNYDGYPPLSAAIQEDAAVRRAKTVVVAHLDPTLPTISLEEWMNALVGDGGTVRWNMTLCLGPHKHPNADDPICVWARGETASKRVASVSVWIGAGRVGHESWGKPHLEDAFVEAANDSFTVERLSGLPEVLRILPSRWPKADLRIIPSDVACKPLNPVPGSRVTCEVTIHNDGGVSAQTVLFLSVSQPPSDLSSGGKRWEGHVAANSRTTAIVVLDWPEGKALVVTARVELLTPGAYPGYRHAVREPNTGNNRAYLRIH